MSSSSRPWSFPKVPLSFLLLVLMGAGLYWWFQKQKPDKVESTGDRPPMGAYTLELFRTEGGLLEVAGLKKTEEFQKTDPKWYGESVAAVRLDATYRYSIKLPDTWKLLVNEERKSIVVVAPDYSPELPVAVDSKTIYEQTSSGWGRFNKWQLLQELRKELSPKLAEKAESRQYRNLVAGDARKTVEEFVYQWSLKEFKWNDRDSVIVKVYFSSDEHVPLPGGFDLEDIQPKL